MESGYWTRCGIGMVGFSVNAVVRPGGSPFGTVFRESCSI
jgi:hypothetical protein